MRNAPYQSACGRAENERNLLSTRAASKWNGFPVSWVETSPHEVNTGIDVEKTALLMIDSGSVRADLNYGRKALACDLTPGVLGLFTAGTHIHSSRWRWAGARRVRIEMDLARFADAGLLDGTHGVRKPELVFQDAELTALVRSILRELSDGCPNGPLFAQSLSLGVALGLHQRRMRADPRHRERGQLTLAQLKRVEDLIRAKLGTEIGLGALAATAGFSSAQFVRLFKNTVGCTPYQYVLKLRVAQARDLVLGTELSLSAIAYETGFANQSHMTAVFVRHFHTPPGEMRRHDRKPGIAMWELPLTNVRAGDNLPL